DLRIAQPIAKQDAKVLQGAEPVLWAGFESLREPVLILRGETSDLLTDKGLEAMQQRNVAARGHTFPGVGHAPTLRSHDQIEAVATFLTVGATNTWPRRMTSSVPIFIATRQCLMACCHLRRWRNARTPTV